MRRSILLILTVLPMLVCGQIDRSNWKAFQASDNNLFDYGIWESVVSQSGNIYVAGYNQRDGKTQIQLAFLHFSSSNWQKIDGTIENSSSTTPISIIDMILDMQGNLIIVGEFEYITLQNGQKITVNNMARYSVSSKTWESFGGFDQAIQCITTDPFNNLYISGSILQATNPDGSTVAVNVLAMWNNSLNIWQPVGGGLVGGVGIQLQWYKNKLHAFGYFSAAINADNTTTQLNHAGIWDGQKWSPMGLGLTGSLHYPSDNIIDNAGRLVITGSLDEATNSDNSIVTGAVLAWDGSTWTSLSNNYPSTYGVSISQTPDGTLYSLSNDFGLGVTTLNVWNGTSWQVTWVPNDGNFRTIFSNPADPNNNLFLGGDFNSFRDSLQNNQIVIKEAAKFNNNAWKAVTTTRTGTISVFEQGGEYLYMGGQFNKIGSITTKNIAAYTAAGQFVALGGGVNGPVYALAMPQGLGNHYLAVGGKFTQATNPDGSTVDVNNLALWDGTWHAVGDGVNGPVYALKNFIHWNRFSGDTGNLHVGGAISFGLNADGTIKSMQGIGTFNFSDQAWHSVGNGLQFAQPGNRTLTVKSIVMDDVRYDKGFYIAGAFDRGLNEDFSSTSSPNIIHWNHDTKLWEAVAKGVNGKVNTLIATRYNRGTIASELWLGGEFQDGLHISGTVSLNHLGKFNISNQSWYPVQGGVDGPVYTISLLPNRIYKGVFIGGDFSLGYYSNGNARGLNNCAIFSESPSGPIMRKWWNKVHTGTNGPVLSSIQVAPCMGTAENVFVGGDFTIAGDFTATGLARMRRVLLGGVISIISTGNNTGDRVSASTVTYPCNGGSLGKINSENILFENGKNGDVFKLDDLPAGDIIPFTIYESGNPGNILFHTDSLLVSAENRLLLTYVGIADSILYAQNPDGKPIGPKLLSTGLPALDSLDNVVDVMIQNTITDSPTLHLFLDDELINDSLSYQKTAFTKMELDRPYILESRLDDGTTITLDTLQYLEDRQQVEIVMLSGFINPEDNQDGPKAGIGTYNTGDITTGFELRKTKKLPLQSRLIGNYPNPFNPQTTIDYFLAKSGKIKITIHNVLGQRITTLVNNFQKAGEHKISFNAENLSSGMYFYQLKTKDGLHVKKMLLIE